jgi:hypothetical protein
VGVLNLSVLQAPDRDWVYSQRSPPVFYNNMELDGQPIRALKSTFGKQNIDGGINA